MCSTGIAKAILIIFNSIFFLLGLGSIVVGVLILTDTSVLTSALANIPSAGQTLDQVSQYSSVLQNVAYVIIAFGAVIFIIGFCGCFGAMKELRVLLFIYALIVFLILAAEIAAVVLGFIFQATVVSYMQTFLNTTISEKYTGLTITNGSLSSSVETYSAAWDTAMITLKCCGNYNYTDFADYAVNWSRNYTFGTYSLTNAKVPISCCKTSNPTGLISDLQNFASYFDNATLCLTDADPLYTNTVNCYDQIVSYVNTYTTIVIGVAIGVACVELFLVICACCLIRSIGKDSDIV